MQFEMRHFTNIAATLTALIILIICGGGINFTKCACSGKVFLITPADMNCCPNEGDCMTVTSLHVSESALPNNMDMPAPSIVALPMAEATIPHYEFTTGWTNHSIVEENSPPGISQSMVMRV